MVRKGPSCKRGRPFKDISEEWCSARFMYQEWKKLLPLIGTSLLKPAHSQRNSVYCVIHCSLLCSLLCIKIIARKERGCPCQQSLCLGPLPWSHFKFSAAHNFWFWIDNKFMDDENEANAIYWWVLIPKPRKLKCLDLHFHAYVNFFSPKSSKGGRKWGLISSLEALAPFGVISVEPPLHGIWHWGCSKKRKLLQHQIQAAAFIPFIVYEAILNRQHLLPPFNFKILLSSHKWHFPFSP